MYRTHTCGELRLANAGEQVRLAGWVQRTRRLGSLLFIDLRDRYGLTQLVAEQTQGELYARGEKLGREYVIQVEGTVRERSNKNAQLPTGEIELALSSLRVLSESATPPFTIEEESDGGDELRMQYRYLDLRRGPLQRNLLLRHKAARAVRHYLNEQEFLEIETPFMIKSTPEGARDFVVPSRMHPGDFYALPQSPQTFKQLLMIAGYDRYYQLVRCFRDEDLRADRQPEFTQIDCEMAFVEREDILTLFEGLMDYVFEQVIGVKLEKALRVSYDDAMARFGSDKPDMRFGMEIHELTEAMLASQGLMKEGEYAGGLAVPGGASYTRKQLDALTAYVKTPQVGGKGLIYLRPQAEGGFKSSADKFLTAEVKQALWNAGECQQDDILLLMFGPREATQKSLGQLRLHIAEAQGWLDPHVFKPLWVIDFPLFEWNEEEQRYNAMHHPFTSPHEEDLGLFDTAPGRMRANAYDFVVNGVEVGGGSIRIHDQHVQEQMFKALGFTEEKAQEQFGFLINAFKYGAPPHGGIAFGFDRLCAMLGGADSIRDFIAFPKNNAGRDLMIGSPSPLDPSQLEELSIQVVDRKAQD